MFTYAFPPFMLIERALEKETPLLESYIKPKKAVYSVIISL